MHVENVDDSVIWNEVVYQTVDVIYNLSIFYMLYCVFYVQSDWKIHCDF